MSDERPDAEQVGKIIKLLETAMTLAEDLQEGTLICLIERSLRRGAVAAISVQGVIAHSSPLGPRKQTWFLS